MSEFLGIGGYISAAILRHYCAFAVSLYLILVVESTLSIDGILAACLALGR